MIVATVVAIITPTVEGLKPETLESRNSEIEGQSRGITTGKNPELAARIGTITGITKAVEVIVTTVVAKPKLLEMTI